MEKLKRKKVLDIGAGEAKFAKAAKRRGIEVVSTDLYPGGMGHGEKMPSGISYLVADFREGLDLSDGTFDVIVARASLHSMVEVQEDLEAVLHEVRRLLKPGGEFRFGPGGIVVSPVREEEVDKWEELLDKVRNKEEITPEEDAWGAKIWPRYEQELDEEEALSGLSDVERAGKLREFSLARLQKIDPNVIESRGNKARGIYADYYYVMKKSQLETGE